MKSTKQILKIGIFSALITLMACGRSSQKQDSNKGATEDMHEQHRNLADNFKHPNAVLLDQVYQLDDTTEQEMEHTIDAYLQIKEALAGEDLNTVNNAIALMDRKIQKIQMHRFEGEGLKAWKSHRELYLDKLEEMRHIEGLENKRSYFAHISEIVYCTIKSFGLQEGNLYAAYCSMAFNNQGAYWITNSQDLNNPYMGSKMPKCGKIKETL
ncbi:MAG: DUF3347 domain-containing protein [Bacteroidales bacterium]